MACRLIRLLSSTTEYRKQASKFCGELVAKALIMERATAKTAIRTVSTLSKARGLNRGKIRSLIIRT